MFAMSQEEEDANTRAYEDDTEADDESNEAWVGQRIRQSYETLHISMLTAFRPSNFRDYWAEMRMSTRRRSRWCLQSHPIAHSIQRMVIFSRNWTRTGEPLFGSLVSVDPPLLSRSRFAT